MGDAGVGVELDGFIELAHPEVGRERRQRKAPTGAQRPTDAGLDVRIGPRADQAQRPMAPPRPAPVLPLLPGVPERRTYDYVRHGTANLYAALDVASGQVIADLIARHRAEEFRRFLNFIDRSVPAHLGVHVIVDNSSTHKTPTIQRWLLRHPRLTLHFTPTYTSWLNLVERWFAELTDTWLRRGTHRSTRELVALIRTWIQQWNDQPRPFVWHKTADEILDSFANCCSRI